jgi:hypothetical protein
MSFKIRADRDEEMEGGTLVVSYDLLYPSQHHQKINAQQIGFHYDLWSLGHKIRDYRGILNS